MDKEKWLSLSREIRKHTSVLGNVHWGDIKFLQDSEERKVLTRDFLLQSGFTEKAKEGCDPDYREYHLPIAQGKKIILHKSNNVFSGEEYFEDTSFDWPTDSNLRIFFFEDQLNAYIEWVKRVPLESYQKNKNVYMKILIIDDEPNTLPIKNFIKECKDFNLSVTIFEPKSGVKKELESELAELCEREEFNFALLDYVLWGDGKFMGDELIPILKNAKIKIIAFCTLYKHNTILREKGADLSETKGFTLESTDALVSKILAY